MADKTAIIAPTPTNPKFHNIQIENICSTEIT